MKTHQQKIDVMQAFVQGQEIQSRNATRPDEWGTDLDPRWTWGLMDYRIKPRVPRVIWVNEYDGDKSVHAHSSKLLAERSADSGVTRAAVKYIEVIE